MCKHIYFIVQYKKLASIASKLRSAENYLCKIWHSVLDVRYLSLIK